MRTLSGCVLAFSLVACVTAQPETTAQAAAPALRAPPVQYLAETEVRGFRWDLEVQDGDTNEVRSYAFLAPGKFKLKTPASDCALELRPALWHRGRYQDAVITCSDGKTVVSVFTFCAERADADLLTKRLSVVSGGAATGMFLKCESGAR